MIAKFLWSLFGFVIGVGVVLSTIYLKKEDKEVLQDVVILNDCYGHMDWALVWTTKNLTILDRDFLLEHKDSLSWVERNQTLVLKVPGDCI